MRRPSIDTALVFCLTFAAVAAILAHAPSSERASAVGALTPALLISASFALCIAWLYRKVRTAGWGMPRGDTPAGHAVGENHRSAAQVASHWALRFVAAIAALPRRIGGILAGYRKAGTGRDASGRQRIDRTLLIVFCALGCVAYVLAWGPVEGPHIFLAALSFGTALTIAHDPDFAGVLRLSAMPRLRHGTIFVASTALALLILIGVGIALAPVGPRHGGQIVERLGGLLLAGVVAGPALAAIANRPDAAEAARPVWPLFAGLVGAVAVLICTSLAWVAFVAPILTRSRDWVELGLATAPVLTVLGLAAGAGGHAWLQGVRRAAQPAFDWSGVFPASLRFSAAMAAVAAAICFSTLFAHVPSYRQAASWVAAISMSIACVIWMVSLLRLAARRPVNPFRAVAAWGLLVILLCATFALSGLSVGAVDKAIFALLFTVPIAVCAWLSIAFPAQRLLNWVIGGSRH